VAEILADANTSSELVSGMQVAADTAGKTLAQIVADADSASATLSDMQEAAEAAGTTLEGIYQDAADAASAAATAQHSASEANAAANDALTQLSTVEDVIGTVEWVAEHGAYELTDDSRVDDSKVYYERVGLGTQDDPYAYVAVAEPVDAGLAHYYELHVDSALSQYVSSHLALTDAGLFVVKDADGYRLLCSNDGVSVIDPQGHVVATYGESVTFDAGRRQYIGNEDAYILFTPEHVEDGQVVGASITIGGSNVNVGSSQRLSDLLGGISYDHTYTESEGVYTFTASAHKGGIDVTSRFDPDMFVWYLRTESGDSFLGTGVTMTVAESSCGYRASIVGGLETVLDALLVDSDGDLMVTDSSDLVEMHGIWEV
jgi:hypothetical protein